MIQTANGSVEAPTTILSGLQFGPYTKTDFLVSALVLPDGIGGLLGADFLKDLILVVNYPNGNFELKSV